MKTIKKADKLADWLIEEYPPFFPIDRKKLIEDIQKNIIEGWIPYVIWYNENHKNKLDFPTDPQFFIERVFHKSINKCEIIPPRIGQELSEYAKED